MRKKREAENFAIGIAPAAVTKAPRRQLIESRYGAVIQHALRGRPVSESMPEPIPEHVPGHEPFELPTDEMPAAEIQLVNSVVKTGKQQAQKRRG